MRFIILFCLMWRMIVLSSSQLLWGLLRSMNWLPIFLIVCLILQEKDIDSLPWYYTSRFLFSLFLYEPNQVIFIFCHAWLIIILILSSRIWLNAILVFSKLWIFKIWELFYFLYNFSSYVVCSIQSFLYKSSSLFYENL